MDAYLCTLDEARLEIKAQKTADDVYVLPLIADVSARFLSDTHIDFEPVIETRTWTFSPPIRRWGGNTPLWLSDYLLNLTAVEVNGTAYVLDDAESDLGVALVSNGVKPSRNLVFVRRGAELLRSLSLTGTFGYRTRFQSEGWLLSGDTLLNAGGINATEMALMVNDAGGIGPRGFAPRFSPGQLVRMDDEMLRVIAVDTTTDTLMALRGQRGSTAAAHSQGATIELWNVEADARRAIQRWVALSYQRRGVFENVAITDAATVITPVDAPAEVKQVIDRYAHQYLYEQS